MNIPPSGNGVSTAAHGELADLIEQLTARLQAGEEIDSAALVAEHPEHADRLAGLLPASRAVAALGGSGDLAGEGPPPNAELGDYRIIALNPIVAAAHHKLGLCLSHQHRFADAEAAFRRAIDLEPDFAYAYNSLAVALKDQGRTEEAEAAVRGAIALKPDYVNAHLNLGNFLQGEGRWDEAAGGIAGRPISPERDLLFPIYRRVLIRTAPSSQFRVQSWPIRQEHQYIERVPWWS
jgi:tetratricopeptide (TPR) repeat protein